VDLASLDPKQKFIHRDLTWLAFNERVLEEAADPTNPLLERVKFLAIFANNLDEFLAVRLAGLKRLIDSEYNRKDQFGYYPQELFAEVQARVGSAVRALYGLYKGEIKRELERNRIFLKSADDLNAEQKKYVKRYFDTTLFTIATPMGVDPAHPFPLLPSKTLAFAVHLKRGDALHFAILPIPKIVPRLLRLPAEGDEISFILVDEIIRANLGRFFKGYEIAALSLFRLLRDSEFSGDEEYAPDLLTAIESELKKRPRAKVVYLEVHAPAPPGEAEASRAALLKLLCEGLGFPESEIASTEGDTDLTFLFGLIAQANRPDLCYPSHLPARIQYENIFDRIREGDFLLHLPYQSFQPTVDLIQAAARDDNVLAVKMTLYRTNEDSAIIRALAEAAKRKKQVTVLVEIKARFEEEKNIGWVKELEEAGCHVVYGMPGMKVHSKIALVVRSEQSGIRRYVHLSTGNYNEKTACIYTDIGYFTANDDVGRDASDIFNVLTGYSLPSTRKRIVSAPYDLRAYFVELIEREIAFQKSHQNGAVFAKMNSLEDTEIIEKLYEASREGVRIRLIVRGICCLVPGVAGLSENIQVKSIVGRFLEHSRIYVFNNNTNYRVFFSSADWMRRNLDRRVELLFEVHRQELREHLMFVMESYWRDMAKSRFLMPDRSYVRQKHGDEAEFNAQEFLVNHYRQ